MLNHEIVDRLKEVQAKLKPCVISELKSVRDIVTQAVLDLPIRALNPIGENNKVYDILWLAAEPAFDCRVEILNAIFNFQYQFPNQLTASPVFRESLFTYAKVLFIKSVSRAKRHQCLHRFASQGNTVLVTLEGYRAKKPKRLSNQWIWTNSKRFIGQKLETG